MLTMPVSFSQVQIADFCRRWRIEELALFGSVLRQDFQPDSDVDVLVTFAPNAHWTLLNLVEMQQELEAMVGRDVDLLDRRSIERSPNWIRRDQILSSAQRLYTPAKNCTQSIQTVSEKFQSMSTNEARDLSALLDIHRFAQTILTISQDMDRAELESGVIKQSAILYQLTILGEAVKRLSPDFRARHAEIPWKQIAGMRGTIQGDIPELLRRIEPLLPSETG